MQRTPEPAGAQTDPQVDTAGGRGLTRRSLMRASGSGLVVVGAGGLLAACGGGGGTTPAATTTPGGTPQRGGTLRLGASGGGSSDTLDAHAWLTNADVPRVYALYEGLMTIGPTGKIEHVLAESIEPNATATEWTVRVRKGVMTHDGKEFGAKDVLFSLTRIIKNKFFGTVGLGPIDLDAARVLDSHTLRLRFTEPYGLFVEGVAGFYQFMVPVGYDPKRPIGTGPFKYQSFTPGEQSTFVRHDEYWKTGKPYLDKLVITDIADETAQVNAFQAGQVDVVDYLSAASVVAIKGAGGTPIIGKTGAFGPFTMRVDQAPFDDVRVRTAMKLVVDRPQMLQEVFGGYGTVGNDVWGTYDADFYDGLPQRQQDLEQAKALLKAAGRSDLTVQLITGPNAAGEVQAAQVFATQAKGAGVTVQVKQQDPTQYFSRSYLKAAFSQDFLPYLPYLLDAQGATVPGAPVNATHFDDAEYNRLYREAMRTTEPGGRRRELIRAMLEIDHAKGGNCIPYFIPSIDGVSSKVRGVAPSITGFALGNFNWADMWLST